MPGPLVVPLIAAGAALGSSGINAAAQGSMNKKTRKFAKQQAALQRQYALEDWAMQNEYNHPSSQMARLREAGLNPNLAYGNGVDTTSGPIRSSEPAHWTPQASQFDLGGAANAGLSAYYDTQVKQAQIDNLRTMNTVNEQEALLKAAQTTATAAQTGLTGVNTRRSEFDLQMAQQLKDISAEAARLGVEKQKADIKYTLDNNDRAAMQNAQSIRESVERILRSRAERSKIPAERQLIYAQIESLKHDIDLKQLDIDLKEKGVQPTDGLVARTLARVAENAKGWRDKHGLKLTDKFKKWKMNPTPFKK